jgi:hypothetical protein
MNHGVFGAAALSLALAMTPALARDDHGGRGGGGMSHGASIGGGSRGAAVGSTVRGASTARAFQGGPSQGGAQFRGRSDFSRGGFGVGLAAGAALGGYYGYNNGYYANGYYDNAYDGDGDGPAYAYSPGDEMGGDSSDYCAQRYRSYDPSTGTYMGFDGQPHPCP